MPGVRGFDAGKKINGRKRHLLVDTLGLLQAVVLRPKEHKVFVLLPRLWLVRVKDNPRLDYGVRPMACKAVA